MGYISRNQAAARIGQALYGEARTISTAKLVDLIQQGKLKEYTMPSLGGKVQRHYIDETSVDAFIKEMTETRQLKEEESVSDSEPDPAKAASAT